MFIFFIKAGNPLASKTDYQKKVVKSVSSLNWEERGWNLSVFISILNNQRVRRWAAVTTDKLYVLSIWKLTPSSVLRHTDLIQQKGRKHSWGRFSQDLGRGREHIPNFSIF